MKAFYMTSFGGPEAMKYGELPDPTPGRGEVLVEVHASSVNPLDAKIRSGWLKIFSGTKVPRVLGSDLAGVVRALGPEAVGYKVGDRVYGGAMIFLGRPGAHAELVSVATKQLRPMPEGWSFAEAASLPTAALTATAGLRGAGDLAGRTVLVNGATGGVGHFAVQIARARGAQVTAVCSARNAELAASLGADDVIDYAKVDVTASGRTWDLFFDVFGQTGFGNASRALTPRGAYASPVPGPKLFAQFALRKLLGGKRVVLANMRDKPEDFAELEQLIQSGAVKPLIEQRFPLAQGAEAYAAAEGGKVRGKVVITVAD